MSSCRATNANHYDAICWHGDWTNLPQTCGGNVEVWDQTVGCPECGMNLWYLPTREQWPSWAADSAPAADHWKQWNERRDKNGLNPYEPYFDLFDRIHPFQFDAAHDNGDADGTEPEFGVGP